MEKNISEISSAIAAGNQEVRELIFDLLLLRKAINQVSFLYVTETKGDEVIQMLEHVDRDKDKFLELVLSFRKRRENMDEFLYGEKYAFPITMLGGKETLVILRESQVMSLMETINRGTITTDELSKGTEGVSFRTNIQPIMENLSYERGHKTVTAKKVTLLTAKPVKHRPNKIKQTV